VNTPDRPLDEATRLDTLRALAVLDTPREERFDRLTRLTARLLRVPMAAIGFMDAQREWFKSGVGLVAREAPRSASFGAHAILAPDLLVVPDSHADARFTDPAAMLGQAPVRFYAGQPLRAENGAALGALAIFDHDPRGLDADERQLMRTLAALVERELRSADGQTIDPLTGISNRRGFLALAPPCLSYCARHDIATTLVLFALDTPGLGDGHQPPDGAAELAITTFAETLRGTFRESDAYARLEGALFVLLLTRTDPRGAECGLRRLRARIEQENAQLPVEAQIDFEAQVFAFDPARFNTVEALLADARRRLYHARRHPR
jgi:diguanylate cyclase (GGDEF)-like protein